MADDNQDQPTQDDEQARLALEEYQRQQAAAAVQASQNQPNAIPNERQVRAVDYTQPAVPNGQGPYIAGNAELGYVGSGPTAAALNRPREDWGTPVSPPIQPGVVGDPNNPQGYFIDRGGANLGSTGQIPPSGAVGIQGVVSPQEAQFWAANPLGAVPHPVTGELIGLGGNVASRQAALESITPPEQIAGSRLQQPDFVNVPQVDAALIDRRNQIANEIANTQSQMRGASTQRIGRGQPSQFETLNAKLATLQHADSALANEHFRQSQQSAHAADQNRKMQEQYNVARDATAAQIAMGRITAQPGTQEYKQAIANIALSYPHAVKDPRVEEALLKASTFHDERAAIAQKAADAGLTENIVGYGQKGPTIQYRPSDAVQQQQAITKATQAQIGKDFAKAGLTPDQFAQRTEVVGVDKDNKQVADGTHMRVAIGDHHFLVPKDEYNRMNTAVPSAQPNPAAQTAQATTPQPTEVTRIFNGRPAVFDSTTKKFLRYGQ